MIQSFQSNINSSTSCDNTKRKFFCAHTIALVITIVLNSSRAILKFSLQRQMILFFLAIQDTKHIRRTNLTGCYDEATSLKLNQNTYTLTLGLKPTNISECQVFEQAVFVNLTLHANGYICDNITLLLQNFTYHNITTLEFNFYQDKNNIYNLDDVFCDPAMKEDDRLQALPELTFGFVTIYTHSHLMTTQVMDYSQVKSNISGCFSNLFALMADNYSMMLTTTPTLVCKNLMNTKPSTGPLDNYIKSMELSFGEISFVFDQTQIDKVLDGYNNQVETVIELIDEDKVMKIAQSDTHTAKLEMTSIQNGVAVQILYNVNFSQVSVRPFFSTAIFTASEGQMFFQYDADQEGVNDVNLDEDEPFESYKLKIIIQQGVDYVAYQQVFDKNQYDPKNNIWVIDCNKMAGFQQQQCYNYSEYVRSNKDVNVQIYVGFFDQNDKFIFHEQAVMTQYLSCIKELEVRYINASFVQASYIKDGSEMCNKYNNYSIISTHLFVAAGDYNGSNKDLYLINDSATSFGSVDFRCFDGESCNLNNNFVKLAQNNYVVLEIILQGPRKQNISFAVFTNKMTLQNDNLVSYPAIGFGVTCMVSCLVMTLHGMIMTMKHVKLIKKKKLKL